MSIEPPRRHSEPGGFPGIIIPLAFVSVILLAAVLIFGALAFDVSLPGSGDDEPETISPGNAVELDEFVTRGRQVEESRAVVAAEVSIVNTSDRPVDPFQMVVQCDDDGYVSAIVETGGMEAGERRTIAVELKGRGNPGCQEPVVEFSNQ